jgi:hypothetical protein
MSVTGRRNRHAAEALKYEEDTAKLVTAAFSASLKAEAAKVFGAFLRGTVGAKLYKLVGRGLLNLRPDIRRRLADRLPKGIALGVRQGLEIVDVSPLTPATPDRVMTAVLDSIDSAAVARLSDAVDLAAKLALDKQDQVNAVLGKANTALTTTDATARWLANRAVSAGTAAVAHSAGARLVWVPERNACLHCLAYAGWVVEVGQPFPPGLSYADKPLKPFGDLIYPPLHPNCRCQVDVTYLPVGRSETALAREAERSVARGLSDFASEPARLRAADRLLRSPTLLPKSVRERARRNVAARKFAPRPR